MSTIKVDTIATRTGSGNITLSNSLATATVAGDLTVDTSTLKVDSSNNKVGIGTTSPTGKLTIDGGFLEVDVSGTQAIRVGSTDHIVGGTDNDAVLQSNTGKNMRFLTGGTERIRLHSGGVVSFNNGIELGSGLDATAANTLDDYEEGIHNAVTTTTNDTSTALGITQEDALQYVKIGSMVYIHGSITVGSTSATGAIRVSLPFAPTSLSEKADISYFNITLDSGDGGGGAAQVGQFIGEVNGAVGAEIRVYATDQLSFQSDSAQSMDISCSIGIMGFYYST